jgi:Asp-tRNA(Asn)/Glu-tRNA(Gln) amidotransferase A subunit family amidase
MCGVYGLKPSHGRVGQTKSTVTVMGPIAASISDLELAYRTMAIPDPDHPVRGLFTQPLPISGHRPKLLGICTPWIDRADTTVQKSYWAVIDHLTNSLGYQTVNIDIPFLPEGQLAHAFTILSESATHIKQSTPLGTHWLSSLNPANQVLLAVAAATPANDYMLAQQLRHLLMSHLAFLYKQNPGMVIVTPTSPMPGWPIADEGDLVHGISDGNMSMRNMEYIWLANFAGCPAISCPAGYVTAAKSKEGREWKGDVPIGVMAMGEWGSEDALIEWGRDVEEWLNGTYLGGRVRPAGWEDVIAHAKVLMSAN